VKAFEFRTVQYKFPQDIHTIVQYLNENGKLNVPGEYLEYMYEMFSIEEYDTEWEPILDEYGELHAQGQLLLCRFAYWASQFDLGDI